jgi:four helix bundle protein
MARILIIEDDEMVRHLLEEHLSNEGYEVILVSGAEEGLALALASPPDLVLLDVNMPEATGFQICARLRQNPATQFIPIIMMTGTARWPNQQAIGRQMGANEYILKPFDVFRLGERIHELMGSKRPIQRQRGGMIETEPTETIKATEEPAPPPVKEEDQAPIPVENQDLVPLPIKEEDQVPVPVENQDPIPLPIENEAPVSLPVENEAPVPLSAEEEVPAPINPPPTPTNVEPIVSESPEKSTVGDEQHFFDFSVEVLILSSQLPKTRAGRHTADQLIKNGTSVGARIQESLSAETKEDYIRILRSALKDLRETGYWLMLIRKAGILETPSLVNLETKCQELSAALSEHLTPSKQIA